MAQSRPASAAHLAALVWLMPTSSARIGAGTSAASWNRAALREACGRLTVAEIDSRYFVGNAPTAIAMWGCDARDNNAASWVPMLERREVRPDTMHRFLLVNSPEVTHVRLDVFPDGGLSRVRLRGIPTELGRQALVDRWIDALPADHARMVRGQPVG